MSKPGQTNLGKIKDPICGMEVPPDSPLRAVYQERKYFFCSERCLAEFNRDPQYYAGGVVRTDKIEDPVCGMLVQPNSTQRFAYNGQDFFFCSPRCLELFQSQPERYLKRGIEKAKAEAPATTEGEGASDAFLTCPMHPDLKEPVPRCPKCGMFLQLPEKAEPPKAEEELSAPAGRSIPAP